MIPKKQQMRHYATTRTGPGIPRILIVDDEAPVRRVLSRFFKSEGFEVSQAADGAAAIEIVKRERFDVVLSDLRMPGLCGLDVLKQIKQTVPETVVLIITAYPTPETGVKALKLCADGYVSKPVDLSRLKSLVVHYLMLRKWQRERHMKRTI
jgi:DNA-binding NtrC family response regulator